MKLFPTLKSIIASSCGFLFLSNPLHAKDPTDIRFLSKADATEQHYVELLPSGFDAAKPLDVIIALHGHGSDRWQFIKDQRAECKGLRDVAEKYGLLLVSPDYRAKTSWMGPVAEQDVVQILAELPHRHKVGRIFFAGGSMGGTGALIFGVLHPELIAGICALNPTANLLEYDKFQDAIAASYGGTKATAASQYKVRSPELWPEKLTMPLALTTGGLDQVVPPESTLRLAEALKKAGRKVLSLHRPAGAHSTNYEDTIQALEFMLFSAGVTQPANPQPTTQEETAALASDALLLNQKLATLTPGKPDLEADARVFGKAITWALRYDSPTPPDLLLIRKAIARGHERSASLGSGTFEWTEKRGKVLRGFVSAVDGSTQPYGLIVPRGYVPSQPTRLDVVLHGSSKPHGMSELRFMSRFDDGDSSTKAAPEADFIELHPLGRVENCYRWAGETDVFEAIEAVCRNYNIDRNRIVLRGMSMGASGTWHLGLKHPDRFVALGPYCGYVDTHRFSETPIPGFIKVGPLPPHQEIGLHMLDSVDYAANAGVVPAIAAIGDKDTFFQSHVHMAEAFSKEGIKMVNLISKGTGHVIDPVTHQEQMQRIAEYSKKGINRVPETLRFVTWTLKYHRCHWLELLSLEKHYSRTEFIAQTNGDDSIDITLATNVHSFALHRSLGKVKITGTAVPLPAHSPTDALVFTQNGGIWTCDGPLHSKPLPGKRPGLQGPIDDAFASPFLCVRGTGKPWNPEIQSWADASLRRFEFEWARYMRGSLAIKDDIDVTEADIRDKHLILFGDPGSNSLLARTLPALPLKWSPTEVTLGGKSQSAQQHAPVFICRNPIAPDRYVVVNSGHTFHEKDFAAFNYLLFPRLGDWALLHISPGSDQWSPASATFPEKVIGAGYFDETWKNAYIVQP
jgi:pimeloyl-ACP methyl ester carboxylesterase